MCWDWPHELDANATNFSSGCDAFLAYISASSIKSRASCRIWVIVSSFWTCVAGADGSSGGDWTRIQPQKESGTDRHSTSKLVSYIWQRVSDTEVLGRTHALIVCSHLRALSFIYGTRKRDSFLCWSCDFNLKVYCWKGLRFAAKQDLEGFSRVSSTTAPGARGVLVFLLFCTNFYGGDWKKKLAPHTNSRDRTINF